MLTSLEELKASLPAYMKLLPENVYSLTQEVMRQMSLRIVVAESPQTAVVINGDKLEKYSYIGQVSLSLKDIKDITYQFKLLNTCLISLI